MYQSPGRSTGKNNGFGKNYSNSPTISEGPIQALCAIIEDTPSDEWQRRVSALESLVEQIPSLGSTYLDHPAWYNSPKSLLHLSLPIQELLKDARSTVVRRVCASLTLLFNRCQSDARLLLKDIMFTVLLVQGQTVQIIRTAVTNMIVEAIPEVPCKSVMPFWMERLKDKSPAVREACSLFLGLALQSWSTEENYLTDEIWIQVGNALLRTLRDPSPSVRQHAKSALINMHHSQPKRWEYLINDPNGPAAKDKKLMQWLRNLGSSTEYDNAEDLSVASKYTYNSESRYASSKSINVATSFAASNPVRISSPQLMKIYANNNSNMNGPTNIENAVANGVDDLSIGGRSLTRQRNTNTNTSVPFSIAVTTTASTRNTSSNPQRSLLFEAPDPPASSVPMTKGLGPPLHRASATTTTQPFSHLMMNSPAPQSSTSTTSTPPRPRVSGGTKTSQQQQPSTPQAQTYTALALQASFDENDNNDAKVNENSVNFDYSESNNSGIDPILPPSKFLPLEESPFIASMHELKKHASKRRSRNSIIMQERFRQSSSSLVVSKSSQSISTKPTTTITPNSSSDTTTSNTTEPTATGSVGNNSEAENQHSMSNSKTVVNKESPAAVTKNASSKISSSPQQQATPPEHIVIAIQLLRAHKSHVDQIMETLKLEMDTLRDFDKLLEKPGRPTEEELITYYESIDLCVQQRYNANVTLRNEMNRISAGK